MVIPYIDINPKGNGYYCFRDRKWELLTFFLGFHVLWISLIVIGTLLRGPGWNWFWPWQAWDPHKVEALTSINLPYLLGFRDYFWSAIFGLSLVVAFFIVGTVAMYAWVYALKGPEFLERWGMVRFGLTSFLFLNMVAVVIKMLMRHMFNIKYVMETPWINI
jgi:hypothetical protein